MPPKAWDEADNIPWNEPAFSQRMLREHLSQTHDAASRRFSKIDQHIAWIHSHVLHGRPSRILDLGCGPGLYVQRLARLGHTCAGIDFSPASIAYARAQAVADGVVIGFTHADLREADFGSGHNLIMLLYGELNVFRPAHAEQILCKANAALAPGGVLLMEPHTFHAVREMGAQPSTWYAVESGLFGEQPHLVLNESFWLEAEGAVAKRYFVVDLATAQMTRYAQTMQAYTDDGYRTLLACCGFDNISFFPSLCGIADATQAGLQVIVADH